MIRIKALHQTPTKMARKINPLRESITRAKKHFETLCPEIPIPGINIQSKLIALPLFQAKMFKDISERFQKVVWG
jgi:hypothetical protein